MSLNNYVHIKKFVDRVRGTDLSSSKPVVFTAQDVKDLNADITKLLLDLRDAQSQQPQQNQTDNITISGGDFKSV